MYGPRAGGAKMKPCRWRKRRHHGNTETPGPTARPAPFMLDGQACQALAGDTVLTAVLTQAERLRRPNSAARRAPGFCMMGACQGCGYSWKTVRVCARAPPSSNPALRLQGTRPCRPPPCRAGTPSGSRLARTTSHEHRDAVIVGAGPAHWRARHQALVAQRPAAVILDEAPVQAARSASRRRGFSNAQSPRCMGSNTARPMPCTAP